MGSQIESHVTFSIEHDATYMAKRHEVIDLSQSVVRHSASGRAA